MEVVVKVARASSAESGDVVNEAVERGPREVRQVSIVVRGICVPAIGTVPAMLHCRRNRAVQGGKASQGGRRKPIRRKIDWGFGRRRTASGRAWRHRKRGREIIRHL